MSRAVLVLENGQVFTGQSFGAVGQTLGEAVFCTAMTAIETLTDPSYHRQIVVATAPQIGNTGWNTEDDESHGGKIWVAGYAVRNPPAECPTGAPPPAWTTTGRAGRGRHRRHRHPDAGAVLRDHGSMRAVCSPATPSPTPTICCAGSRRSPDGGRRPGGGVHRHRLRHRTRWPARFTVAALDLGIKTNTPRMFAERGIRAHVLPSSTSLG